MVFEHMDHNLREVLDKYGKGVGINLQGVQHFARQLLVALHHLDKLGIVHADLKPDNILVDTSNRLKVSTRYINAFGTRHIQYIYRLEKYC
jgi:serine/threonine-protein kinase PRP4